MYIPFFKLQHKTLLKVVIKMFLLSFCSDIFVSCCINVHFTTIANEGFVYNWRVGDHYS